MRPQCPLLALADMPKNAIDVAIGGKADMGWCSANVCLTQSGHHPRRLFLRVRVRAIKTVRIAIFSFSGPRKATPGTPI
jgi:hypothetical protein